MSTFDFYTFPLFIPLFSSVIQLKIDLSNAHGHLIDPIQRGSRWRTNSSALHNYNDNELYCGGYTTQHQINQGKCGICGDDYRSPVPRSHELGGIYGGDGVIVRRYQEGSVVSMTANLTANHKGYFTFDLCNLDQAATKQAAENENCFKLMKTKGGEEKWKLPSTKAGQFTVNIKLPDKVTCKHCVVRWTYIAANNYHECGNGLSDPSCGPQETFKNCADVSIVKSSWR